MEIKLTMRSIEMNSPHFFELPVFTVPQQEPELMGYEKALTEFEEIIKDFRLLERPRPAENLPEFKM
jgi:hypothetical protein